MSAVPSPLVRGTTRSLWGVHLVSLALLAAGCPVIAEIRKEDALPISVGFTRERIATPEMTDTKLGLLMRCRTSLAGVLNESWEHYVEQVDEETGRLRSRGRRIYLHAVDPTALRPCAETLREARSLVPTLPETTRRFDEMVVTARTYAAQTRALDELLATFPDRQEAWIAVFHPLLRTSIRRWREWDGVLDLELDTAKQENDPKLLSALEKSGRTVEYTLRRVIITSRPYVRCAVQQEADAESCAAAFGDFDLAYLTMMTWVEEENEKQQASLVDPASPAPPVEVGAQATDAKGVFWLDVFVEDATSFKEAAAALQEHRGGLHQDSHESDVREMERLDEAYRNLQRSSDILDFDFP